MLLCVCVKFGGGVMLIVVGGGIDVVLWNLYGMLSVLLISRLSRLLCRWDCWFGIGVIERNLGWGGGKLCIRF